jgi:threonine dehydrogenase-like Zn-dependent dehydrogenase
MKAVVTHDVEDARIEERPKPEPAPDEALLSVRRVQLSVTDCWQYLGELAMADSLTERVADGGALAFSHEFCADVVDVGEEVIDIEIGDRAYASGKVHCNECGACRRLGVLL